MPWRLADICWTQTVNNTKLYGSHHSLEYAIKSETIIVT